MLRQIHTLKDNPFAGIRTLEIRGTRAENYAMRPENSFEKIQTTLNTVDCQSCGKCCQRVYAGRVQVYPEEMNRATIVRELANKGKHLKIIEDGSERMLFDDKNGCTFLDDSSSCAIYQHRPNICGEYPFGLSPSLNILAISSRCPPLSKLKDSKVNSVYLSDIFVPINTIILRPDLFTEKEHLAEFLELVSKLNEEGHTHYVSPLLGSSLLNVKSHFDSGAPHFKRLRHSPFMSLNGQVLFLIN